MAKAKKPWIPRDTFGARLALVRQTRGWNVKAAADACQVNPQSWTNWERGASCRTIEATAQRVAEVSGCDYVWLMAGGPLPR